MFLLYDQILRKAKQTENEVDQAYFVVTVYLTEGILIMLSVADS